MRLAPLLLCLAACRDTAGTETLKVGTAGRHYELFVPSDTPGLPLVIVLHGGGGHGRQVEKMARFDEVAAREQFVVAYPDGIGHHWNDGRAEIATGADGPRRLEAHDDDVGFIAALIDELAIVHKIDRRRVYITGISNGGMMAYRLACELGDRIVAIAPVAGNLPAAPPCKPGPAVSLLAINGTADPLVPYAGGQVLKTRGAVRSAPDSVAAFATRAGCTAPTTDDEPDVDPEDGARTRRTRYACPGKRGVELLTIVGGGHTWPGHTQSLPKAFIGGVSRDFDATERIWQFFVDHTP